MVEYYDSMLTSLTNVFTTEIAKCEFQLFVDLYLDRQVFNKLRHFICFAVPFYFILYFISFGTTKFISNRASK